ncbi:MAG: right-handed parallel beta-helix repeat-containing protein [Thermoplasmatales archaeon]|nr:MAG: right-handed parallel beta-helix repeat-containing protein [Thermoplasmatales archaeon]
MKKSIIRKGMVLGIIVLFIGVSVVPSTGRVVLLNFSQPATVYVDDDYNSSTPGWGYDHFDKIQDGINAVNVNGTVFVFDGTYYENVDINKDGINLIGENKNTTIIDSGNDLGSGILIKNHNYVTVSNFTIMNAKYDTSAGQGWYSFTGNGISIWSFVYLGGDETANHNLISDCIIYDNEGQGVMIASGDTGQSADYNSILNCEIYDNGYNQDNAGGGIRIWPDRDGVTGWAYTRSNQIIDCVIHNNERGIHIGREGESSNNVVIGCDIFDNSDYGIYFWGHDGGGVVAITINNYIYENTIYGNQLYGLCIESTEGANCGNNYIYHNNFMNSTNNAYDEHSNIWNDSYPSGGNFWSDYTGDDFYKGPNQDIPGSDGIGDKPYNISGDSNQDLYPLMHPFELYYILNISAPPEVNEGELFNVVVTSEGGTPIPNATVDFNDELKLTDMNGRVYFTAPQVGWDIYYDIIATKEGYTNDSETILVKDVSVRFVLTFIYGSLDNLTTTGDVITFEAININIIKFLPFSFSHYALGELITILKGYFGIITPRFIFAFCFAYV